MSHDCITCLLLITFSPYYRPLVKLSELVDRKDLLHPANTNNESLQESKSRPQDESKQNGSSGGQSPPAVTRVHYSDAINDAKVPEHILQIMIPEETRKTIDEGKLRSFAAAKMNAELRMDSENVLLLFQSSTAASRASQSDTLKKQFNATLEPWKPRFFPTSMF